MSVPAVTFPLEQDQVKSTYEMLYKHLRGLQADIHITQELMKMIRTFCKHPNKGRSSCPDCGADWGD